MSLNFINCSDRQLREELNSGRIDLAFLMTNSIDIKEVNVQMLKSEKLILVSSPAHLLTKQTKVTLDDLNRQTVLLPKTD